MKLFTGSSAGPVTVKGEHQTRMALFALKHQGWHSYAADRTTMRALRGLQAKKIIEVSVHTGQFRWNDQRTA